MGRGDKKLAEGGTSEPGQTTDGLSTAGVSIGAVHAIDPPDGRVAMVRPEDRAAEPVVAQVPADKVDEWKREGWIIKE